MNDPVNLHVDATGATHRDLRSGVVDVSDRLAPGAKALVRERTEQMLNTPHPPLVAARLDDAVAAALGVPVTMLAADPEETGARAAADALAVQPEPWRDGFNTLVRQVTAAARDHEEETLRAAFTSGRAYERGAAIRRRIGKSLAARRTAAEEAAREYLDERTPDAPRLAAMVLAGFTGTEVA
jgi:hypothetical protein